MNAFEKQVSIFIENKAKILKIDITAMDIKTHNYIMEINIEINGKENRNSSFRIDNNDLDKENEEMLLMINELLK
jgi:hypothetical protein